MLKIKHDWIFNKKLWGPLQVPFEVVNGFLLNGGILFAVGEHLPAFGNDLHRTNDSVLFGAEGQVHFQPILGLVGDGVELNSHFFILLQFL